MSYFSKAIKTSILTLASSLTLQADSIHSKEAPIIVTSHQPEDDHSSHAGDYLGSDI